MRAEEIVRDRIKNLFLMKNLAEVSRRTGYPRATLQSWKDHPERIRAVDLIRLEELLGRVS